MESNQPWESILLRSILLSVVTDFFTTTADQKSSLETSEKLFVSPKVYMYVWSRLGNFILFSLFLI